MDKIAVNVVGYTDYTYKGRIVQGILTTNQEGGFVDAEITAGENVVKVTAPSVVLELQEMFNDMAKRIK